MAYADRMIAKLYPKVPTKKTSTTVQSRVGRPPDESQPFPQLAAAALRERQSLEVADAHREQRDDHGDEAQRVQCERPADADER